MAIAYTRHSTCRHKIRIRWQTLVFESKRHQIKLLQGRCSYLRSSVIRIQLRTRQRQPRVGRNRQLPRLPRVCEQPSSIRIRVNGRGLTDQTHVAEVRFDRRLSPLFLDRRQAHRKQYRRQAHHHQHLNQRERPDICHLVFSRCPGRDHVLSDIESDAQDRDRFPRACRLRPMYLRSGRAPVAQMDRARLS